MKNMKKKRLKKYKINARIKKAWDYSVAAFCLANNGSYFLSQQEIIRCLTKDFYYFSKNKAKQLAVFPKNHKIKISSMKKLPKEFAELIKKIRR